MIANILTQDDSLCAPQSFNISVDPNQYNGSYHWTWNPNLQSDPLYGASLIYTQGQTEDPNPLANFPDNTSGQDILYTFILETWIDSALIVNSGGLQCADSDILNILIHPRPTIDISSTPVCEGDTSIFIADIQFGSTTQLNNAVWNLDGSYSLQNGSISDSIIGVIYNDCGPDPYEVSHSL